MRKPRAQLLKRLLGSQSSHLEGALSVRSWTLPVWRSKAESARSAPATNCVFRHTGRWFLTNR